MTVDYEVIFYVGIYIHTQKEVRTKLLLPHSDFAPEICLRMLLLQSLLPFLKADFIFSVSSWSK